MADYTLKLQKPLEETMIFLEKLGRRSAPLLLEMAVMEMAFCDPVHDVRGRGAAISVLERRFITVPSVRYKVYDFSWGRREGVADLRWSLTYDSPKNRFLKKVPEEKITSDGMTELCFTPDGQLASWHEFWDLRTPFVGKAYSAPLV